MEDTASRLTSCYNNVWELRGGQNCGRRKLLSRMRLERIKKGVDKKLESSRLGLDPRKVQLNTSLYLVTS